MQVLGLVPTETQAMKLLSVPWSNMTQNDESVDLVGKAYRPFQHVVLR